MRNRRDIVVALCFLLLGGYLVVTALGLPAGVGRLPGAGFFPLVTGVVTLVLTALLFVQTWRRREEAAPAETAHWTAIGGVIGLTFFYLLLWGTGLFWLRTVVFLALFLRLLGEAWKTSFLVSATLTVAVTLAFQVGLRISLE